MKKRILLLTLSLLSLDTFAAESPGASSIDKKIILPNPPLPKDLADQRENGTRLHFSGHRIGCDKGSKGKKLRAASASASGAPSGAASGAASAAIEDTDVIKIIAKASIPLPESLRLHLSRFQK